MNDDIFSLMRKKAHDAKTDDPLEIADCNNVIVSEIPRSITGYATAYRTIAVIGLNRRLKGLDLRFTAYHELTHVFAGDIYDPSLPDHLLDNGIFNHEVDSRLIPRHEKRANLVSADMCVQDEDVIEITGYNNPTMQSYRRLKEYQEKLIREFNNLSVSCTFASAPTKLKVRMHDLNHKINDVGDTLREMESDLFYMNCYRSFSEMASDLGINERILRYKLEAMRIRGYDIDRQELEHYSKMFKGMLDDHCSNF